MGGRSFDVRNKALPACVEQMAANPPPCFTQPIWRLYLVDSYREVLNRPGERARMSRGVVPDFCEDCPREHREAMRVAGRCEPPTLAPLLRDMAEDADQDLLEAVVVAEAEPA